MSPATANILAALRKPASIVVLGILLIAAVGLNATARYLKISFQKLPVPLREPLPSLPARLGPWMQVSVDKPLSADMEHALTTKQYVFRVYLDTSKIPQADLDRLMALDISQREGAAYALRARYPAAVLNVAMTYYTGMVDTVAHIPERCFVAGGFDISGGDNVTLPVPNAYGPDLTLRLLSFTDRTTAVSSRPLVVGYVFAVNGSYQHDAINGVRLRLQNLLEKHGYYAKIELMMEARDLSEEKARQLAEQSFTDFLRHAMGDIERILPDWSQVTASER